MNLDEALAATSIERGPQSHLEQLLHQLEADEDERAAAIRAALASNAEANHLGRALTLIARDAGVVGDRSSISGASIRKWRESNGPR